MTLHDMEIASYVYAGYGRSLAAEKAEAEGKMPLTRATPTLAKMIGVTQKRARQILEEWGPCEWHHTGKYARRTDYYDVGLIAEIYRSYGE